MALFIATAVRASNEAFCVHIWNLHIRIHLKGLFPFVCLMNNATETASNTHSSSLFHKIQFLVPAA
jgi:hypothetical protein